MHRLLSCAFVVATAAACSTSSSNAADTNVAPPQLVAPLSFARATSRTPTFHYVSQDGVTGARIQLCADRACTKVLATVDGDATHATASAALPPGIAFWRAYGKVGDSIGAQASPVWEMSVGQASAAVDTAWGTVPDLNADGLADVLVTSEGSPQDESPPKAHLFLSSASGLPTTESAAIEIGNGDATLGDVDGDGFLDLLVASVCSQPSSCGLANAFPGSVSIFPGTANGPASAVSITLTPPAGESFSRRILAAGDLNGDGYADLAVQALCAPATTNATCTNGLVHIFYGSATGPNATPDAALTMPDANGGYSYGLAAGDFDGDGIGDLVVGAGCAPMTIVSDTQTCGTGRMYVFSGSTSGIATTPSVTWSGKNTSMNDAGFGGATSGAGDFNGDGYADIATNDDSEAAITDTTRIFFGASTLSAGSSTSFDGWRAPLAAVGDINGDGIDDLLASGVPEDGAAGTNESAGIFFGSATGTFSAPSSTLGWSTGDQPIVSSWSGGGDINGDGFGDLVQGIPCVHGSGVYSCSAGTSQVFFGGASSIPSLPSVVLADPSKEGDDDFGADVW